ncbi:putative NADPH oxidase, partial [Operophtera brumata]
IDRWLVPPKVDSEPTNFIQKITKLKPYQLSLPYLKNNYALISYLGIFFFVNIVLFVTRCYEYRDSNGFVILARGCGQCLNFTCAWVLVLMLRHCITALRVRGLGSLLPLDHHIYLHKIFYWTHLLYVPFWVLLILHGPNFYKWSERSKTYISSGILLPSRVTHLVVKRPPHLEFHAGDYVFVNIPEIAFYEWHPFTISRYIWLHIRGVGEWTNRLYSYFEHEQARHRDLLRSESDHSFDSRGVSLLKPGVAVDAYKSPQYKDLEHRRRLSKTISPDKDVESIKEKSIAEEMDTSATTLEEQALANLPVGKPLEIYIDGPYGAASSHIFQAQHAALIAAGIGVTPFASILQAIMYRYWEAKQQCPKCQHTWTASLHSHNMRLRKVDFFWINREQRSFEWFVSLLSQLEMEQAELGKECERFLEMHMYITSALQRNDMKAVGLQLALDLLHAKTRTNAGRPNWDKVFKRLQEQNKGKVTVFYCGPPQLARTLKIKCNQYGFNFRKEVF